MQVSTMAPPESGQTTKTDSRAGKYLACRHYRARWSETYAEKFNRIARFRCNRRKPERRPGWTDEVICACAVGAGAVGPEDDSGHMFCIEQ